MLTLLALLTAAAPLGSGSSASVTGFADDDVRAIQARLHRELEGCAGGVVDVEAPTPCDEVCAGGLATTAGVPHLVMIEALRVGGDVDVQERVISNDGKIEHDAHRTVPAAAFETAVISPEVCALVKAAEAPKETPTTTTTRPLHPAWYVTGAGGAVAVVGLLGFAIEASTLEDPTSAGSDKERARVTGTIALAAVFVGVVAAGVATGIALSAD
jgi:hypothetical protein